MDGLNRWTGIGNCAADAELRQTSGDPVLNFRIGCTESYLDRNKQRLWYADFWLSDASVAVEYFGLAGQPEYDRSIDHKTQVYLENGIGMVPVRREHLGRGLPDYLMGGIERILHDRYERFRTSRQQAGRRSAYARGYHPLR